MLPTTVAENIAYGRPDATRGADPPRRRAWPAPPRSSRRCPRGTTPRSAESGSNLSGGQRQRIAIARALLTEAPIIVLDEPTSALDPHNEQMITETLRELKRQRTIILVSHRLSTVADCDEIFVMDAGRIVEQRHARATDRPAGPVLRDGQPPARRPNAAPAPRRLE